jgi:hypothetical protein
MEDHELITDFGDEQLDVQSSGPGRDHCHLDGLVGYVVGAGDAILRRAF